MVVIDPIFKYSANFYTTSSMFVRKSTFVIESILLYFMRGIVACSECNVY